MKNSICADPKTLSPDFNNLLRSLCPVKLRRIKKEKKRMRMRKRIHLYTFIIRFHRKLNRLFLLSSSSSPLLFSSFSLLLFSSSHTTTKKFIFSNIKTYHKILYIIQIRSSSLRYIVVERSSSLINQSI
jgi:hypothetical protein